MFGARIAKKLAPLMVATAAVISGGVVGTQVGSAQTASGTTYYISASGNDAADGKSEATAFKKINTAMQYLKPGDTVLVMNGTYTEDSPDGHAAYIEQSGRPDAWITFRNYPGHRPKIKSRSMAAFKVTNSRYVRIEGFDIEGSADEISEADARARRCDDFTDANRADPFLNKLWGNGIDITAGWQAPYPISSHIEVRNNRVWNFSGAGISAIRSDWITVENNEVFNNSSRSPWDTSGISFYQLRDETDDDSANASRVKNVIRGNMIYGNRNDIGFRGIDFKACATETSPTDGNGIIIDDLLNTQNAAEPGYNKRPYQGRTLVVNNVSHHNGGRGINVYSSRRVDVVNNTTYHNAQKAVPENSFSEVSAVDAQDVTYMNNVVVAKPGRKLVTLYQAADVTYTYNLFRVASHLISLLMRPTSSGPIRRSAMLRAMTFG